MRVDQYLRARKAARRLAKRHRWPYVAWSRRRHGSRGAWTDGVNVEPAVVERDTELLIEAVESSGNTFTVVAFQLAQDRPTKLAHHLHSIGHVKQAAHWNVPALMVARHPKEACTSRVIRYPWVKMKDALRDWCAFHRDLVAMNSDRVVIAGFESVTTNLAKVIAKTNDSFGTTFKCFAHSEENAQRVFGLIEERYRARYGGADQVEVQTARPSSLRKDRKAAAVREYEDASSRLRAAAEQIFGAVCERADV